MDARAPIRFGTDGWRGRCAFEFTFAEVERVAAATAEHFASRGLRQAVVGYDRRFLSAEFAHAAARAICARGTGAAVSSSDIPTPALSWATAARRDCFGVMITASHNPSDFNGFKIKEPDGASLGDEAARDVEKRLDRSPGGAGAAAPLEPGSFEGIAPYRAALAERVDVERIRARSWSALIDSMHGTGGRLLEEMLRGGRARVTTLRAERDVLFGGHPPEPLQEHLAEAARRLAAGEAELALATDGDADRLAALDERGEFVGSQILAPLLALHLVEGRERRGALAKTFAQTCLLDRMAAELGLPLRVRPIGFKHLAALLRSEEVLVASEESGGIGVGGFLPERDGLLSGLLVLEALCARDTTLAGAAAELRRRFGDFHYRRIDLRSDPERGRTAVEALAKALPAALGGRKLSGLDRLDGLKCLLGDDGWILFRQSGTEPVLRVYAEARGRENLEPLLKDGVAALAAHLPHTPRPARLHSAPE
jgi:phosphomannomutase